MTAKQQLIVLSLIYLCFSACTTAETKRRLEEIRIVDGNTERVVYQVEVATDTSSRRRGLMHRKALAPDHGMLLDYKSSGKMAIWMKNTYIPLDIIFVDMHGVIVKIHERAEPLSTKRILSESEVRAVLEINAGQVREHGIKLGDQLRHASFRRK